MGRYRVLKDHDFKIGPKGKTVFKPKGSLVDIELREHAATLMERGIIGSTRKSHRQNTKLVAPPAPHKFTKMRVGVFVSTSRWYSGGRLYLYQYMYSLATLGVDVFLITDDIPKWVNDYPQRSNLKILQMNSDKIPQDLDVLVTDVKSAVGKGAFNWKLDHPNIPVVVFNFETPNWVNEYIPEYASRLNLPANIYKKADHRVSCSHEGARYVKKYIGEQFDGQVLVPAVNTYAIQKMEENEESMRLPTQRPYAVWSARGSDYKGGKTAVESIMQLPFEFDLVLIGSPGRDLAKPHPLHKVIEQRAINDQKKYFLMKHATLVLAPSLFEGYGMVPGEAMAVGTPSVVYDLPVLREEYGDSLHYAEWDNSEDFCRVVSDIVQRQKEDPIEINIEEVRKERGLERMAERVEDLKFHAVTKKKVSVQMISYWGFLPESLESLYPYADEIFIAFGREKNAIEIDDGSWDRLSNFPDPDNKIRIEKRDKWSCKKVMRRWCLEQMSGNYQLILDGDEIWTGVEEWLRANVMFSAPRMVNFWHNIKYHVTDYPHQGNARWGQPLPGGGCVCPHYRSSHLRRSYYWQNHPWLVDAAGRTCHITSEEHALQNPNTFIYHMGHCFNKEIMTAKHDFYLTRDGADPARQKRKTSWHNWNGEVGDCGDGIIRRVDWEVPEIVQRAFKNMTERTFVTTE